MNMSFALTTPQFRARTKDVTRRLGWFNAKAGQVVQGIEKGQSLKKGEHPVILGLIRFTSVRREPLCALLLSAEYGRSEVIREGFPEWSPQEFVEMFCRHNACHPERFIARIEFVYL